MRNRTLPPLSTHSWYSPRKQVVTERGGGDGVGVLLAAEGVGDGVGLKASGESNREENLTPPTSTHYCQMYSSPSTDHLDLTLARPHTFFQKRTTPALPRPHSCKFQAAPSHVRTIAQPPFPSAYLVTLTQRAYTKTKCQPNLGSLICMCICIL
jgi:hypothetical protein